MSIFEFLLSIVGKNNIKQDEPLSKYTYTNTGGKADFIVFPFLYEHVKDVICFANSQKIPVTILGNGSNLIVRDGGIRGIVISLLNLSGIHCENNKIIAEAGATIINTSRFAQENKLTGLEFACGIPGSVGGAVYMNAGAYDGEISDVLESVLVLTKEGDLLTLSKDELELSYRHSIIPEKGHLVLEATFSLKAGSAEHISAKMNEFTFLRESKQPLEFPSCGSVFKRPSGKFAGKLIQDAGLQGYQIGGVQISTKHAGFMVNLGNGTATDYLNLIHYAQKNVQEKFGVFLEPEVKIIGEE